MWLIDILTKCKSQMRHPLVFWQRLSREALPTSTLIYFQHYTNISFRYENNLFGKVLRAACGKCGEMKIFLHSKKLRINPDDQLLKRHIAGGRKTLLGHWPFESCRMKKGTNLFCIDSYLFSYLQFAFDKYFFV